MLTWSLTWFGFIFPLLSSFSLMPARYVSSTLSRDSTANRSDLKRQDSVGVCGSGQGEQKRPLGAAECYEVKKFFSARQRRARELVPLFVQASHSSSSGCWRRRPCPFPLSSRLSARLGLRGVWFCEFFLLCLYFFYSFCSILFSVILASIVLKAFSCLHPAEKTALRSHWTSKQSRNRKSRKKTFSESSWSR